jgi:hypothetical protein
MSMKDKIACTITKLAKLVTFERLENNNDAGTAIGMLDYQQAFAITKVIFTDN